MAATQQLPMQSRTGRTNQRYGPQGERLVAGIVPLSADKYYVLLIQSTRRGGWVLPKGGWETDEATAQDAAKREAWEEAGIIVKVNYDLGLIPERRRPDQLTAQAPKASYHFFEATVEKQEVSWPEMHKRSRQWFTYSQAKQALGERPELIDALERCTMNRA